MLGPIIRPSRHFSGRFSSSYTACRSISLILGKRAMSTPSRHIFDRSLELSKSGPGRYTTTFSSAWKDASAFENVNKSLHGGLVIALISKAIEQELSSLSSTHSVPLNLSTQFIAAALADLPILIHVEIIKRGRRFTYLRARLEQQARSGSPQPCIEANGCYGAPESTPDGAEDFAISDFTPPPLPAPSDCRSIDLLLNHIGVFPVAPNLSQEFRLKLSDPAALEPLKELAMTVKKGKVDRQVMDLKLPAWIGFVGGRPHDVQSTIYFSDFLPPVNSQVQLNPYRPGSNFFWDWTTLSFSINFLNPVPAKPLLGVISTMEFAHNTKDRRGAVHNVIWDQETNKVIAVSRQAVLMTAFPMYESENIAKI